MVPVRPPRYLFVCTANINRSPTAAAWAEKAWSERFVAAEIRSAGTHAWEGNPAGAYATDAMRELGVDLRAHRSQPLTLDLVAWADYVVVMEGMHADIADQLGAGDSLVRLWEFIDEEVHEVTDPQGGPLEDYQLAARVIRDAVNRMVTAHVAARRAAR